MKKLILFFYEPLSNLSKHIFITIITIFFLAAFFFFIGAYSNAVATEDFTFSLKNNETYLTYRQMFFGDRNAMGNVPFSMYEELNYLVGNDPERKRRIEKESDQFICDLYDLQNDDFLLEYCTFVTIPISGLPDLFARSFIQADESFFEHEYLPICKGRAITEDDFEEIRNSTGPDIIINVIAGYSYTDYYEIGDILSQPQEYMEGTEEIAADYKFNMYYDTYASYRIVGFIEEGVTFSNYSGSISTTDSKIFVPYIPAISINFPEIAEKGNFGVTWRITTDWKLYIKNGKTDEYADLINQKLDGTYLGNYCDILDAYNQAYAILDEVVAARNDSFIFIAVILLIFSMSGIIVMTVNKFKSNIRSYTIHLTVGATNTDICFFSAVEMLIQILISLAIVHLPFISGLLFDVPVIRFIDRNIPYMRSPVMYMLILAFSVLFIITTVAVTAWCIRKYSIAETIKGKE